MCRAAQVSETPCEHAPATALVPGLPLQLVAKAYLVSWTSPLTPQMPSCILYAYFCSV